MQRDHPDGKNDGVGFWGLRRSRYFVPILVLLAVGIAVILLAVRFDHQAVCDSANPRLKIRIWCKEELQPPFDQLIATCPEVAPSYTREGRVVKIDTLVKRADGIMIGRALEGSGIRCDRKHVILWMRLIEFPAENDARLAQRWIQEESIRMGQLAVKVSDIHPRDGLPEGLHLQNPPDQAWSYAYDDYEAMRDNRKTTYIEEGVYFRVGRWGGLYHIRLNKPPRSSGITPPHHAPLTKYLLDDEYFTDLFQAIDLVIPRLQAMP